MKSKSKVSRRNNSNFSNIDCVDGTRAFITNLNEIE